MPLVTVNLAYSFDLIRGLPTWFRKYGKSPLGEKLTILYRFEIR